MTAAAFTFPVTIYYEDTDAAGVVYYANYLKFMERARTEWMKARGHAVAELEAVHGIVFVVAHVEVTYRAPGRLGDTLTVGVAILDQGRSSLALRQDVTRAGTTLVAARVTLACVAIATFKPVRIPSSLLESLR